MYEALSNILRFGKDSSFVQEDLSKLSVEELLDRLKNDSNNYALSHALAGVIIENRLGVSEALSEVISWIGIENSGEKVGSMHAMIILRMVCNGVPVDRRNEIILKIKGLDRSLEKPFLEMDREELLIDIGLADEQTHAKLETLLNSSKEAERVAATGKVRERVSLFIVEAKHENPRELDSIKEFLEPLIPGLLRIIDNAVRTNPGCLSIPFSEVDNVNTIFADLAEHAPDLAVELLVNQFKPTMRLSIRRSSDVSLQDLPVIHGLEVARNGKWTPEGQGAIVVIEQIYRECIPDLDLRLARLCLSFCEDGSLGENPLVSEMIGDLDSAVVGVILDDLLAEKDLLVRDATLFALARIHDSQVVDESIRFGDSDEVECLELAVDMLRFLCVVNFEEEFPEFRERISAKSVDGFISNLKDKCSVPELVESNGLLAKIEKLEEVRDRFLSC